MLCRRVDWCWSLSLINDHGPAHCWQRPLSSDTIYPWLLLLLLPRATNQHTDHVHAHTNTHFQTPLSPNPWLHTHTHTKRDMTPNRYFPQHTPGYFVFPATYCWLNWGWVGLLPADLARTMHTCASPLAQCLFKWDRFPAALGPGQAGGQYIPS